MEIQAAADCLGVSIYTYCNERWLEYSCKNRQLSDQGVYLENCNGNHYETVVCVQQPQKECCYGYCKVHASSGYNVRQQTRRNSSFCVENFNEVATSSCVVVVDSVDAVAEKQQCSMLCSKDEITLKLNPLGTNVAKKLCSKCNFDFEKQDVQGKTVCGSLGVVRQPKLWKIIIVSLEQ